MADLKVRTTDEYRLTARLLPVHNLSKSRSARLPIALDFSRARLGA